MKEKQEAASGYTIPLFKVISKYLIEPNKSKHKIYKYITLLQEANYKNIINYKNNKCNVMSWYGK